MRNRLLSIYILYASILTLFLFIYLFSLHYLNLNVMGVDLSLSLPIVILLRRESPGCSSLRCSVRSSRMFSTED